MRLNSAPTSRRAGARVPASDDASAFAVLRDTTATLAWLGSMLVQRDSYTHQVRLDPVFDFVRGRPGYTEWEERSGLPAITASGLVPDSGAPRTLAPLR